jgi:succinoglycan biosynthesis protein ExoM
VTPPPDPAARSVDIAVCTFRRPSVVDTLRSIGQCRIPEGWTARIIVVDNDDTPSAKPAVDATAIGLPLPVTFVHAPGRNISIARNAALDAATARFLAFIDDDETASPDWLASLIAERIASGADVVLGPVDATYRDSAAPWLRRGAFHDTRPVFVEGRIVTGYTCNVLLDRQAPSVRGRRFRVELGRSGGEDTAYFAGLSGAGGRIAYAERALLSEPVPESRETFGWLLRRRYRSGQTHGRLLRESGIGALRVAMEIARALGKAAACFAVAAPLLPSAVEGRRWILRGTLHVGVAAALAGSADLELYGSPNGADLPTT